MTKWKKCVQFQKCVIWLQKIRKSCTGRGPIIAIFFLFLSDYFYVSPIHPFKRLIILNVTNRLTLDGNINNFYAHARFSILSFIYLFTNVAVMQFYVFIKNKSNFIVINSTNINRTNNHLSS
jgi:hypothetical protein